RSRRDRRARRRMDERRGARCASRPPARGAVAQRTAADPSVALAPAAGPLPGASARVGPRHGGAAAVRRGGLAVGSAGRPRAPRSHLSLTGGLFPPPPLPGLRQQVDGVVVFVLAGQGLRIALLDPGPVVLRPVRDALLVVVVRDLVHPALAH